jgi:hypothetical protein
MSTPNPHHESPLAALVARWRANAAVLRYFGAHGQGRLVERLAAELEAELSAESATVVDMAGAVQLSGYSRGHLRRLLRNGQLRNVGTDDSPEFHTYDLPRKPVYPPTNKILAQPLESAVNSRLQVARAVVFGD